MNHSTMRFPIHGRMFRWPGLLLPSVLCLGCGGPAPLTADMPLHLEDHLAAATVVGSRTPENVREPVVWGPEELRSEWKRAYPFELTTESAQVVPTEEALRLVFTEGNRDSDGNLVGGVYVDSPGWTKSDWGYIVLRARATPSIWMGLGINLKEPDKDGPMAGWSRGVPLQGDGTTQTYRLRVDQIDRGEPDDSWTHLVIWFSADRTGTVDILSIQAVPIETEFASEPAGVRNVMAGIELRRSIFVHTPARLQYRVEVPPQARLDVGLGVLRAGVPVSFEITATTDVREVVSLYGGTHDDPTVWTQLSVDLSHLAGRTVDLELSADGEPGTVALWAAPTLSGSVRSERPNIIFYVIDGAAAEHMSVYGYNRRTTPFLERLAREGAVFEYAYSNSSWTGVSTPSFITSLQSSAMGGGQNGRHVPPLEVRTAADLLHGVGYQTALLTTNANAGTMNGLDRGVDMLREAGERTPESSSELHADFWRWRAAYPGQPYWVHFQTTDVHSPNLPVAPFAGLYVSPEARDKRLRWSEAIEAAGGSTATPYSDGFQTAGVDRHAFFDLARGMYDETMAQQDARIGDLVERLKAVGEWENTLLIIASDHGHQAGSTHFGLGLTDTLPPIWEGAILSSFQSRIPLMFVWPGRIAGGQRFSQPVSMLDVLPTILDLVDLPLPEVMMGQSLAPLLLGQNGWEPRPVIFDEFVMDAATNELRGQIEVIDGRWGASLYVGPPLPNGWIHLRGHRNYPPPGSSFREGVPEETPRLLLYDVWNDPHALHSLHEERPDLVEKYTAFLEGQLAEHLALAQQFTASDGGPALTEEQLRTLRALGYIQ